MTEDVDALLAERLYARVSLSPDATRLLLLFAPIDPDGRVQDGVLVIRPLNGDALSGKRVPAATVEDAFSLSALANSGLLPEMSELDVAQALSIVPGWRDPMPPLDATRMSLAARLAVAAASPQADWAEAERLRDRIAEALRRRFLDTVLEPLRTLPLDAAASAWRPDFAANPPSAELHAIRDFLEGADHPCKVLRSQAIAAAPALGRALAASTVLRNTVDRKQPLFDTLAGMLGVPRAIVQRLAVLRLPGGCDLGLAATALAAAACPPEWLNAETPQDAYALECLLAGAIQARALFPDETFWQAWAKGAKGRWSEHLWRLDRAWRDVRPPEGWTHAPSWRDLIFELDARVHRRAALRDLLQRRRDLPPIDHETILERASHEDAQPLRADRLGAALVALRDTVLAFGDRCVLPVLARTAWQADDMPDPVVLLDVAERTAARLLLQDTTWPNAFAMARRFVNRLAVLQPQDAAPARPDRPEAVDIADPLWEAFGAARPSATGRQWFPIHDPIRAPTGLWLVPLWTAEQLEDEGRGYDGTSPRNADGSEGLRICVGISPAYRNRAMQKRAQILSIRERNDADGGWRRLACLEADVEADSWRASRIVQLRGPHNAAPDDAVRRTAEWWDDAFRAGRLPIRDDFRRWTPIASDRPVQHVLEHIAGHDWRKDRETRAEFDRFLPIVGEKVLSYEILKDRLARDASARALDLAMR